MKPQKMHAKKKSKSFSGKIERKRKLMDVKIIALQAEYAAKEKK